VCFKCHEQSVLLDLPVTIMSVYLLCGCKFCWKVRLSITQPLNSFAYLTGAVTPCITYHNIDWALP